MSASHIDQADSVPEWESVRLSDVCTFLSGGTPSKQRPDFWTGTIPWVSPKDLKRPRLSDVVDHISEEALANGSSLAPAGAVFVVIRGMILARDVPVALAERPMAFNQDVKAVIPGERVDPAFLLYALTASKKAIHHLVGRSAHGTMTLMSDDLGQCTIPLPPTAEQHAIVDLLASVQRAIEQQERLLALTGELKKALLAKLFTEGLHGEPQAESEVGRLPEHWSVERLGRVAFSFDYGTSVKCGYDEGFPVLRIPNVASGAIDLRDLKRGQPKSSEMGQLQIASGDLLFVRTNGVSENAGRCALYRGELPHAYFASYLIRVRVDTSRVLPAFVAAYAQTSRGMSFLSGKAIRTADGKFNINTGTLKDVLIPLPPLNVQAEVVHILDAVEAKMTVHARKRAVLSDLFRTLLHQLMTARLRVHDLDLSALEATVAI